MPNIELGNEGGLEDDGMGGRLGAGPDTGGIISPYSYQPTATTSSHGGPHMAEAALGAGVLGAGAAAASTYPNEKRRQNQYAPQQYGSGPSAYSAVPSTTSHYPNSGSEGGHYSTPSEAGYPPSGLQTSMHTGSSSGAGAGAGYYPPGAFGRGPSPGHSMVSAAHTGPASVSEYSSSAGGPGGALGAGAAGALAGGRSAKEMEAMGHRPSHSGGMTLANPDEPNPNTHGHPSQQQHQAYLQYGPGASDVPDALRPGGSSHPHTPLARPGSAVVVHEDGGRVILPRKGDRNGAQEEVEEEQPAEIPPTYDSLAFSGRRDDTDRGGHGLGSG